MRKHVHGTAERPRLALFRSNKHLVLQVIDDDPLQQVQDLSRVVRTPRGVLVQDACEQSPQPMPSEGLRLGVRSGIELRAYDLLPYTDHVETVACFERRPGGPTVG